MSVIVKVGKRYTVVIPKKIRDKIKIKEGTKLLVRIVDGKNSLGTLTRESIQDS